MIFHNSLNNGQVDTVSVKPGFIARFFIKDAVESMGHKVLEAGNGRIGYEILRKESADIIVCDLFVPEQDGCETIAKDDKLGEKVAKEFQGILRSEAQD